MGAMHAQEFAAAVSDDTTTIDQALIYHLQHNHYPPVPVSMVEACKAAIEACQDEDYDQQIELPEGCSFRGRPAAPACEIVNAHHLDAFLYSEEEEDDDDDDT
jgi:hypothetical protein